MREFEGRVAVITGGASGIGLGMARRFAAAGMKIVLADIEQAALDAARAELRAMNTEVIAVRTDVRSEESMRALEASAVGAFGKVHILCNNAGVVPSGRTRATWEFPFSDWKWTFDVNVSGVIHGLNAFLPGMLAHGEEGHIVNTGSIVSFVSGGQNVVYSASKFAVGRITEALYANLRDRGALIGVSLLCPGVVNTRIREAERNRPAELSNPGGPAQEDAAYQAAIAKINESAMTPAEVAEMVFAGVRDRTFYVLTTAAWDSAIASRSEDILQRRDPQFPDMVGLITAEGEELAVRRAAEVEFDDGM